jgi:putative tRNA adenosine deaminase-associated protein
MAEQIDGIDFAVAAYREEGEWQVQELVYDVLGDVPTLAGALRRFPGDGGAIGMVAIDEDFFVIVRVAGPSVRILLSDITAAEEWELASSAVAELGLPEPDEDDDEQAPAGDLDILGDLGMAAMDMGVLLDDFDLYPDEMLSDVARRLGFGALFDEAVGLTSA